MNAGCCLSLSLSSSPNRNSSVPESPPRLTADSSLSGQLQRYLINCGGHNLKYPCRAYGLSIANLKKSFHLPFAQAFLRHHLVGRAGEGCLSAHRGHMHARFWAHTHACTCLGAMEFSQSCQSLTTHLRPHKACQVPSGMILFPQRAPVGRVFWTILLTLLPALIEYEKVQSLLKVAWVRFSVLSPLPHPRSGPLLLAHLFHLLSSMKQS